MMMMISTCIIDYIIMCPASVPHPVLPPPPHLTRPVAHRYKNVPGRGVVRVGSQAAGGCAHRAADPGCVHACLPACLLMVSCIVLTRAFLACAWCSTLLLILVINSLLLPPPHVDGHRMHDMGSLGRTLQIDLPRDWASLALRRDVWRGVVSRC